MRSRREPLRSVVNRGRASDGVLAPARHSLMVLQGLIGNASTARAASLQPAVVRLMPGNPTIHRDFEAPQEQGYWLEEYTHVLSQLPGLEQVALRFGAYSEYCQPNMTPSSDAKAVFIHARHEALNEDAGQITNANPDGLVVVSSSYLQKLARLEPGEAVATLLSTVRHELKHAQNASQGLVDPVAEGAEHMLDEVLAHCENVLNTMAGEESAEAPLWDQLEHLAQAREYLTSAEVRAGELAELAALHLEAKTALKAAEQRIRTSLQAQGIHETQLENIATAFDSEVAFADLGFDAQPEDYLTRRSQGWAKISAQEGWDQEAEQSVASDSEEDSSSEGLFAQTHSPADDLSIEFVGGAGNLWSDDEYSDESSSDGAVTQQAYESDEPLQ